MTSDSREAAAVDDQGLTGYVGRGREVQDRLCDIVASAECSARGAGDQALLGFVIEPDGKAYGARGHRVDTDRRELERERTCCHLEPSLGDAVVEAMHPRMMSSEIDEVDHRSGWRHHIDEPSHDRDRRDQI